SQPALIVDDRVYTLPYPDMQTVIAVGAKKRVQTKRGEAISSHMEKDHRRAYSSPKRDCFVAHRRAVHSSQ
ncbi:MAG TPA: hypothetical protein VK206_19770, partial [Anaerolineales bacterium]|nr:hypothetical protein [Anaerolineales bacterium]